MSAVTVTAADVPVRGTHPNPVVRAARLQLVAYQNILAWPWGILALSFAINLAIFSGIEDAQGSWTGGLMSIYVVMFIGTVQLFTKGLPFAMGMSVTRRAYYAGTWVVTVAEALVFGAVLYGFRLVEDATDGWGISLSYFGLGFPRENPVLEFLSYVVPFLLLAAIGACVGMVIEHWSYNGVMAMIAGSIVLAGAAVIVVARMDWWDEIGGWFDDQSAASLFVGWPLPFAVVFALLGYLVIRRATP
jgi:hypothetical protein